MGTTALEIFNDVIVKMQTLHDSMLREHKKQKLKDLKKLAELNKIKHKRMNANEQNCIDDIEQTQREIQNKIEKKTLAANLRVKNFYRHNTGKCVPVTFMCVQEGKKGREITELETERGNIKNMKDIAEYIS